MEDFLNEEGGLDVELAAAKPKPAQQNEGQLTIDVFQDNDDIIIQSTIAGVDPEKDLDISITKDMVTIRGTRSQEKRIKSSDYYYQELYWGSFSRSVILPADVDTENSKASYKNGVLTIRLPKLEKTQTKTIKIFAVPVHSAKIGWKLMRENGNFFILGNKGN